MALDDRVSDLVAFVHVADVDLSIAFYGLLGFEVTAIHEHEGRLDWCSLERQRARLMLARASAPIKAHEQAVLFYLYTQDLSAFRDHLLANGVAAGPIRDGSPGPSRELRLADPDGYCLMVAEIEGEKVRFEA